MPPALIPSDDEYASDEDSDFVDDAPALQGEAESSDEDSDAEDGKTKDVPTNRGTGAAKSAKRKRAVGEEEAEDAGFENSGDEAIIERGLKRQKKKGKKGALEDDEGGEGGIVKTRSMRAQEKVEKKPLASTAGSTIDVDALWAQMISNKPLPPPNPAPTTDTTSARGSQSPTAARNEARPQPARSPSTTLGDDPNAMIMIKRTYNFAGKVHTEQKLVSRNSAEAKLYLASHPEASAATEEVSKPAEEDLSDPSTKPRRPPRKARRSIFEPVVDNLPKRTDLHFGIRKDREGVVLVNVTGKEKKINVVEKSAMDWAGFVDKAGIADELDAAGKSKGAYRAQQDFLARVESKRVDDERRAKGLPSLV